MTDYLKLANEIEKLAASEELSLEKVASLCLLYEYEKCDGNLLESKSLIKTAERKFCEDNLALELGINAILQAFQY